MKTSKKQVTKKSGSSLLPQVPTLTPKEKAVLEFIESRVLKAGVSPTYQEIREHFGLASFNSVQNYLKQLSAKGYVHIPQHQKRAIQILRPASSAQDLMREQFSTKAGSHRTPLLQAREEILSLPLLGRVAAGRPIEALSHDEFVDVPPSMVRNPDKSFLLEVQGESMIDDGIWDGDLILVQKQSHANNGDIIVATVDNEATVKRFYLRNPPGADVDHKQVELRPANSKMKSMWFSPDSVEVRGLVVALIRKY